MVNMGNIVSRLQLTKRAESKRLAFRVSLLYIVFVVPLKYLVIGIANGFFIMVYKTLTNGCCHRHKGNARIQIVENAPQALQLLRVLSKHVDHIFIGNTLLHIRNQHIELAVEYRLFVCCKLKGDINGITRYFFK